MALQGGAPRQRLANIAQQQKLSWRPCTSFRTADLLANSVLSDSEPPRDLPIAHTSGFQTLDDTPAFGWQPSAAGSPSAACGQRDHSTVVVALQMAAHGAFAAAEPAGNFALRRVAAVDQRDHGVCFCHRITCAVVVKGKPCDKQHAVLALCAQRAAAVDDDGPRRRRFRQE